MTESEIVTCVVIVGAFAYGRGAFGNRTEEAAIESPAPVPASTSSTTPDLEGRDYQRGQCVTWDQSEKALGDRITNVVPCGEPHLFEFVATKATNKKFEGYPTQEQLDQLNEELCVAPVREYLGYDLDPAGRFYVSDIHPTEESWADGERDFDCGIGMNSLDVRAPNVLAASVGIAKGSSQDLLYSVGTCVNSTPEDSDAVDCGQPWTSMVTGNVEVKSNSFPASNAEWSRLIGDKCDVVGKAYRPDLYVRNKVGWYSIERSSWDAGRRVVQCSLSA